MPSAAGVLDYLNKWFAAAVAAGIAIWVIILNVEIDSTIETLILALSPVIASYLWPQPMRGSQKGKPEDNSEGRREGVDQ